MVREKALLTEVEEEVSPKFEIASLVHAFQKTPLLFRRVEGYDGEVAANFYSTKHLIGLALDVPEGQVYEKFQSALSSLKPPKRVGFDARNWEVKMEADLSRLPILTHYEKEAGPYLSSGVVAAKFPGLGKENLSVHRMLVLGKKEVTARIVPRHLYQISRDREEVDIAVSISPDPAVFMSAALQPPYGVSEYDVANSLMNGRLELMQCETVDAAVPVNAEIVFEGKLYSKNLVKEGPYVDLTGTYDDVRLQSVMKFTKMRMKRKAIYHAVLGGGEEHKLFMGIPQELKVWDYVRRVVPRVRGVNYTSGGTAYFHCIISIDKITDGDGKTAIMNCFAASHALKLVIAVDSDIDPYNWDEVEWALATRFQAHRGLIVIEGARGSTLDPSSQKTGVTTKLGIDATLPVTADRSLFEKAKTVRTDKAERIIQKLLSKTK